MLVIPARMPAHADTLRDALAAAYAGNPAIQAERARQRADDEAIPQAISGWLPVVTVDGSTGKESIHRRPGLPANLGPDSLGIELSQPLFNGFQTLNAKRKAEASVRAGQEQLSDRTQAILLDATKAYMAVVRDRAIAGLRAENVRFLRTELETTRARKDAGDLSKTDVAQARARLQEGLFAVAQAEADRDSSEATYASLIGHLPGRLVTPPSIAALLPASKEDAVAIAQGGNPAIQSAVFRQAAADFEIKEVRGEILPKVSLDLRFNREFDGTVAVDREDEKSVFVRMSMPLYQGGAAHSRIREAQQSYTQRGYEVTDTRSRTKAEVHRAWEQLRAAKRRIRAAELQVAAAREALTGVKIEADVGERALFEVLDAQREVVNGRVALERARHDLVVTSYSLLAAIGRLSVDHLDLAVEVYDPHVNLSDVRFSPLGATGREPIEETDIDPADPSWKAQWRTYEQAPPEKMMFTAPPARAPRAPRVMAERKQLEPAAPVTSWDAVVVPAAKTARPSTADKSWTDVY